MSAGSVFDTFGSLDILVNNAGIQSEYASHKMPTEKLDQVLAVNLRGPYLYARESHSAMARAGSDGHHYQHFQRARNYSPAPVPELLHE